MNLKKNFKTMLFGLMLFAGCISFAPSTIVHASTYKITAETQYINQYTPAKRVCGYLKDSNGNPLANKTLYISHYNSYISSQEQHKLIKSDEIYATVTTDSNGYYSLFAYETGYYYVFLPSRSISDSDFVDFYHNGGQWPSRFVIQGGRFYTCDDYESTYALISNH